MRHGEEYANKRIQSCDISSCAVGRSSYPATEFHIAQLKKTKMCFRAHSCGCSFKYALASWLPYQTSYLRCSSAFYVRCSKDVGQASKNMEVELVTSSCKILPSLSLDYLPCHTLSIYVILGERCILLRAKS